MGGTVVANALPGLKLSLRDAVAWALDAADEDSVAGLEDLIEQLEAKLKDGRPMKRDYAFLLSQEILCVC